MCDKQNSRHDRDCGCGCGHRDDNGFFDRSDVQSARDERPDRDDYGRREHGHSHRRRCGVCGLVDCIGNLFSGCGCRRR